ncbi:hypothetical protein NDU88_002271 [Pleurodeles waltl]|uniref:Iodothyronine deiodinase n=3 Tax=Pleurodeles waltl TaxID=8319 RepID=A0AAV7MV72_PLEWA|nr:hypothetical protein NDU88_002271 [Pleurodeles waltl]
MLQTCPAAPHALRTFKQVCACCLLLPRFLLTAIMLWLLDFLCLRRLLMRASQEPVPEDGEPPDDPPVCVSDSNRMFSLDSLRAVWHGQQLDFYKAAHLGCPTPNTEVIQPDGQRRARILDYSQGQRPLVLNFGSCT